MLEYRQTNLRMHQQLSLIIFLIIFLSCSCTAILVDMWNVNIKYHIFVMLHWVELGWIRGIWKGNDHLSLQIPFFLGCGFRSVKQCERREYSALSVDVMWLCVWVPLRLRPLAQSFMMATRRVLEVVLKRASLSPPTSHWQWKASWTLSVLQGCSTDAATAANLQTRRPEFIRLGSRPNKDKFTSRSWELAVPASLGALAKDRLQGRHYAAAIKRCLSMRPFNFATCKHLQCNKYLMSEGNFFRRFFFMLANTVTCMY